MKDYSLFAEAICYEPISGSFTWRRGKSAGKNAGSVDQNGYLILSVRSVRCKAHRFALAVCGNEVCEQSIVDHINGQRLDNRLINLRLTDAAGNRRNQTVVRSDSTTGWQGVEARRHGTFRAVLYLSGRKRYFGTFCSAEDAHTAYLAAKRRHHIEFQG